MEQLEVIQMYLFGNVKFLDLLLIIMLIDIATGVLKAVRKGNLFTKTAFTGYAKKVGVFCVIILANIIDKILGLHGAIAYSTVLFYIAAEGLSVVENLAEIGIKMPDAILDKLKVIQDKNKNSNFVIVDKKDNEEKGA